MKALEKVQKELGEARWHVGLALATMSLQTCGGGPRESFVALQMAEATHSMSSANEVLLEIVQEGRDESGKAVPT